MSLATLEREITFQLNRDCATKFKRLIKRKDIQAWNTNAETLRKGLQAGETMVKTPLAFVAIKTELIKKA